MKRFHLFLICLVLTVSFILVTGCSKSADSNMEEKISDLQNQAVALQKEVSDLKAENNSLQEKLAQETSKEVTVYFIKSAPTEFYLVPEKRRVPAGGDLLRAALGELVKGPYINSGLDPVLPKGSQLLDVRLEGKKAIVDFNAATKDKLNVGSTGEALVISSIVNTVTEFPGIEEVQILIEGKSSDSLAGHIDLTQPFRRNEKDIRKQ